MAKLAVKVACMVVLCMIVVAPNAEAAITCSTVVSKLGPCLGYVQGKVSTLPSGCCPSIKALANAATSTPDRQTACKCLKQIAGNVKGINMGIASGLPGKCGVSIGYPISTSVDCSQVH